MSSAPIGHVIACDEEWYKIVQRGPRLGHMGTVVEADIFRDPNRNVVPDGVTGIPKLKRLPCGSSVDEIWRSRVIAFDRCGVIRPCCLRSPALDSLFLSKAKLLKWIRRTESAFHLFRMPAAWKSFLALA